MRNLRKTRNVLMGLLASTAFMFSCEKEEVQDAPFTITAMEAGEVDLNGATAPGDVPTDASIVVTFGTEVDPATATEANVKLIRDYDAVEVPVTVSTSGKTLTIAPEATLGTGTLYAVELTSGLKATNGSAFTATSRSFTTAGTFAPAGVMAHFTFENSAEDVAGSYDPTAANVVDVTYVDSRNASAGTAASFNGSTTIIEVPNADDFLAHDDFTISFWVKANSTKNGQFVLGLAAWHGFQFEIAGDWAWVKMAGRYKAADGTSTSEDAFYNGTGETRDNGGWQGWTVNKDVSATGGVGETYFMDKWAHVVVTYDSEAKVNTMYINGEKVKEHDFNLWPEGDLKRTIVGVDYDGTANGNKLALGFIQGREDRVITDDWANYATGTNQFKGLLDDIRIFGKPVTATEVQLMYNSEK